jgi:hypothetical protein
MWDAHSKSLVGINESIYFDFATFQRELTPECTYVAAKQSVGSGESVFRDLNGAAKIE